SSDCSRRTSSSIRACARRERHDAAAPGGATPCHDPPPRPGRGLRAARGRRPRLAGEATTRRRPVHGVPLRRRSLALAGDPARRSRLGPPWPRRPARVPARPAALPGQPGRRRPPLGREHQRDPRQHRERPPRDREPCEDRRREVPCCRPPGRDDDHDTDRRQRDGGASDPAGSRLLPAGDRGGSDELLREAEPRASVASRATGQSPFRDGRARRVRPRRVSRPRSRRWRLLIGISFLTPLAGLFALTAAVPLAALALMELRSRRLRRLFSLRTPRRRELVTAAVALALVPTLVGVAAAQPVVIHSQAVTERVDAQVYLLFDTSLSMSARTGPHGPTRLARAKREAKALIPQLGNIPVGVATLTDRVLPSLLPTTSVPLVLRTVNQSLRIDEP